MNSLRSGLILFVLVTTLATAIGTTIFISVPFRGRGWSEASTYGMWGVQLLSVVTIPSYVTLVLLAWRGRRCPIMDGSLLIAGIGLLLATGWYLLAYFTTTSPLARLFAVLAWLCYAGGMLSLIPAHIITILALRRTPLLRGLVAPPKSKGPAEASPP